MDLLSQLKRRDVGQHFIKLEDVQSWSTPTTWKADQILAFVSLLRDGRAFVLGSVKIIMLAAVFALYFYFLVRLGRTNLDTP